MKRIDMRGYKILPRYMLNVGVISYFQLCLNTCGMENWIDGGKNALSSSQVLFAKNANSYIFEERGNCAKSMHPAMFH